MLALASAPARRAVAAHRRAWIGKRPGEWRRRTTGRRAHRRAHVSTARRRRRAAARRCGARRARLFRGRARYARCAACAARHRDCPRRAPAAARGRVRAAVGRARSDGGAPEAGDRRARVRRRRGSGVRTDLQGGARACARRGGGLPDRASAKRFCSSIALLANEPDKVATLQPRPRRWRSRIPTSRRRSSPSRLPRTTPGSRNRDHRRRDAGDRPRARAEARLGAGDAAQGGDPRQAVPRPGGRLPRRGPGKTSRIRRCALSALAQVRIQQKRYGEAVAILEKLWEKDKSNHEYQFRHGDARDPDEGLGARRGAVRGT